MANHIVSGLAYKVMKAMKLLYFRAAQVVVE